MHIIPITIKIEKNNIIINDDANRIPKNNPVKLMLIKTIPTVKVFLEVSSISSHFIFIPHLTYRKASLIHSDIAIKLPCNFACI